MIASAALLFASAAMLEPQEIILEPVADVWVYPFASDATRDPFLRAWGFEGKAVAGGGDDPDSFSYSYLKWKLPELPAKYELKEATLTLFQVPNEEFDLEAAKKHPLEARPVATGFEEKTWVHGNVAQIAPAGGEKGVFGTGFPAEAPREHEVKVTIDLLKGSGDFKAHLAKIAAQEGRELGLALTSSIDPQAFGRGAVYKVYSKDGPKGSRPVLRLVLEKTP